MSVGYLAALVRARRRKRLRVIVPDWDRLPLGHVPDWRIGELLHIPTATVRAARKEREIASFRARRAGLALRECVARALNQRKPRRTVDVLREVLCDFGTVSSRQVRRVLARLEAEGAARRSGIGLVLCRKIVVDECRMAVA